MKKKIRFISILAFTIPILTVLMSYFFSIKLDYVSFCIPNIDGCTSISQVGRYPTLNFFFKTFMFNSIFFIYFYGRFNYFIISENNSSLLYKLTFFLGIFSIFFFSLYIIFLGEGDYYRFFRRIGIFIYIFFTVNIRIITFNFI